MTWPIGPAATAAVKRQALANILANSWTASAPLAESEFDAELHPRGRTGKWVKARALLDVPGARVVTAEPEGDLPTELLGHLPIPLLGTIAAEAPFSPEDLHGFGDGLRKGFARHPELLDARRPYHVTDVSFTSYRPSDPDAPLSWVLATGKHPTGTSWDQNFIINDHLPADVWLHPSGVAPSNGVPEGAMTHEIGHAYFNMHGLNTAEDIVGALRDQNITPVDVSGLSTYGSAMPGEALAEMYAMTFTPGFQIPDPELRAKFKKLMLATRPGPGFVFPDRPLPKE